MNSNMSLKERKKIRLQLVEIFDACSDTDVKKVVEIFMPDFRKLESKIHTAKCCLIEYAAQDIGGSARCTLRELGEK